MSGTRKPYTPRLSFWPIKAVRWRSRNPGYGDSRAAWQLYLFGLVPIARLPRRDRSASQ